MAAPGLERDTEASFSAEIHGKAVFMEMPGGVSFRALQIERQVFTSSPRNNQEV